MQIKPRAAVIAAFGVGPLLLAAGCGGGSATGPRVTLANIQPSSYVEIEPATTTTTTTIPASELVAGGISPTEQIYTVQGGDSISKIASLYDIKMDTLVNYNTWPEGLDHFLQVGDQVKIPPNSLIPGTGTPATGGTGTGTETTIGATASGAGCQHTIVSGDNPTRVAKKYGITVDELSNANLNNPVWNTFLIGSQLTIPPGGSC